MMIHEAIHVRQLAAGHVPITTLILALVEALLLMHEGVRILLVLLANSRMIGQELLQIGVALHKLLVVYQRWIFAQLLRNFRMAVHKMVHVRQLTASYVSITTLILALVEALLLMHEGVRILLVLLANSRMIGQELLQIGVALHKLLVVYQRWIFAQLLRNFRMAVHKMVHVRQLTASYVSITTLILALVEALLLMHEGVRILLVLLANSRMIGQELLQIGVALHKLLVVYQRWIFAQLLRNLRMAVHKMVHVRQLTASHVPITTLVFAAVKALLLVHEGIRILLVLLANSRMIGQEPLQIRVALHELLVVYQRWIFAQLLRNLRMAVHKMVHVRQLTASHIPITTLVFAAVKALLLVHEGIRILLVLLANSRMIGQELLQIRVALHELLVVYQRWIFAQLLRNLRMAVHKMVHVRQLTASHVPITTLVFAAVKALLLVHEGIRILLVLLANSRMIGQELFQIGVALHNLLVVYQRWIFALLLRNLRVAVHKMVHVRQLTASHVPITTLVFAAVKALLLVHEGIRILLVLLANSRMIG